MARGLLFHGTQGEAMTEGPPNRRTWRPNLLEILGPPLLVSVTLGLAPFTPEPHLVGKLRWVGGGAHGMAAADWFDLALHGLPWLWLAMAILWVLAHARRHSP